VEIRVIEDRDTAAVLAINEASVWATSPMDQAALARARSAAAYPLVAELDGEVAGFAIAYQPGSTYDSINYRWHAERFDDFLYLDRIVISSDFRRRGLASALYDAMEQHAKEHGRMVCEVNSDPPNVESLAFHAARGYREVGHLTQADGHQTVMLEKPL
jgi:predicted GNAT superfamily acetyltransferase